jgi:hypothetical protein
MGLVQPPLPPLAMLQNFLVTSIKTELKTLIMNISYDRAMKQATQS